MEISKLETVIPTQIYLSLIILCFVVQENLSSRHYWIDEYYMGADRNDHFDDL